MCSICIAQEHCLGALIMEHITLLFDKTFIYAHLISD